MLRLLYLPPLQSLSSGISLALANKLLSFVTNSNLEISTCGV